MELTFIFSQILRFLIVAIVSFFVGIILVKPVDKLIKKIHGFKHIEKENAPIFSQLHAKKEGTPTMAGIIIWGTVLIVILVFWLFSSIFDGFWQQINFLSRKETYLPLASLIIAALIGMVDDLIGILGNKTNKNKKKNGLSMKERIALYSIVAIGGAYWFAFKLNWDVINIPFIGNLNIGIWASALIFIFIIIATSFSMNETNGLDGLAEGIATIALICLAIVSFLEGRYDLAVFAASLIGALLAFLWFNIYPAKFFMGDTGSMSLGVVIGVISMLTNTVFLLPFFAFILVIESLSVIIQTFSKKLLKKKIFISTPLHHHFEAKGWLEPQITMRFWMISGISAMLGIIIFIIDRFILN
ncbi:MAG TPA: phospho-N-acetylmuramoyl-pentapeptide-transferase [Candidatus Paceibacterota bacterium]|jgi:phospho-N-acetylmuramoyl-pentapeptide-transferase|nr:phospho-N-acetylmuramoyl-pentapeptide-transferase [Candidatus Paceibacterota bacterium]HRS48051.1 phospho-N-acetylmuramoyl-pentapeptide-transferase [Candidatus Paceibacterota bacterium]